MRKNENGLQWIVTETAQKKLHFPWGAWVVCAVLTVGFCLLLTAAFPSVPYPWWAMTAAAILVQAAFRLQSESLLPDSEFHLIRFLKSMKVLMEQSLPFLNHRKEWLL